MIKETFIALKGIGVTDQHILDVIEAFEARHDEFRREIQILHRDLAVLKWASVTIFGVVVTILFKVFAS